MQAVLPATCFQLLGLPPATWHSIPRQQVQQDLLQAAAQAAPSKTHMHLPGFEHTPGHCSTSTALTVSPLPDHCSLFFGQTGPQGQPLLLFAQSPQPEASAQSISQTPPSQHGVVSSTSGRGAMDICVGDAVDFIVEVHSSLPQAVSLKDLSLTLALLQEVTVAYSPKSAGSGRTDFSRTNSSLRRQAAAHGDSPTATGIARTQSGDLTSAVTAAAGGEDADVITQWQETEELVCPLAQTSASGSEASHGDTDIQQLGGVQVTAGAAVVQPGLQRLVFRACPLKRGLYSLKHMTASLHQLTLHIPALPRQAPQHPHTHQQHAVTHCVQPDPAVTPAVLGSVLNTGLVQQQTVVLNVHSCRQRVAVCAAALRGALVAGQPQWLGIAVVPMHDPLHEACIHVGMPNQSRHSSALGSNPLAASLGSRSSTASSASHSAEDGGTVGHSLNFLHPDRAVIAPLLPEAVAHPQHPGVTSRTLAVPPQVLSNPIGLIF